MAGNASSSGFMSNIHVFQAHTGQKAELPPGLRCVVVDQNLLTGSLPDLTSYIERNLDIPEDVQILVSQNGKALRDLSLEHNVSVF